MDQNVTDQGRTSHDRAPARRRIPTAVLVALIGAVPTILIAVFTFVAPTLTNLSWIPFLRALGLLGVVVVLSITGWWVVTEVRERRQRRRRE